MLVYEADRAAAFGGSRIRLQRAERNVRKRRLAGAVLTDEPDDRPRGNVEIDAVDGNDLAEPFDDPAKRERRRQGMRTGVNFASSSRVDGGLILPATIAARRRATRAMLAWPMSDFVYAKSVRPTPSSRSPMTT